ncbi:rhomboid family intramembrane serine protease [Myxosarcina sp. GI1]|uniref:rhomboid family intramembrane serine protease n=1 Tax=Myxosarcina sp. GI1 TaxID=1541065 RepID=UPI00055A134A|nr:rhomboid family intramembrane serine protease [Myxosarcina sp. GI1]
MKHSSKRIAYTTYTIIGLNLFLYALEIRLGGSTDIATLERLGALIPERVEAGEWWRLIGANFLHYGSLHLATNMLALYFIGRLVEFNLGARFYLIVYLASGIGSMLTFSWLALKTGINNVFLVGASAAIMGLIGAILAISLQLWFNNKSSLNTRRLRQVIIIILVQFIFDNLIPQVSFQSHLFGLIIGFLVSSFLLLLRLKMQN